MAKRKWIFLSNTFEVNTRGSNVRMLSMATDTHSKLQAKTAEPDIAAVMTTYDPVFQNYKSICANYDAVAGNRKGNTLNVETIFKEALPVELRKWEAAVRAVYVEDSPEEVAIFPNKRKPFQGGTYEDRLLAIETLYINLAADANFAALSTVVQSFHNLLLTARDTQQQKEGSMDTLSTTRENQRKLMAVEMHGALGALIYKYRSDIEMVADFFDLSLLRDTNNMEVIDEIEGVLAASEISNIGNLTANTKQLRVTVINGGALEFGLSVDGTTFNGNTVAIASAGDATVNISEFNSAGFQILLHNQNETAVCTYKVELLG